MTKQTSSAIRLRIKREVGEVWNETQPAFVSKPWYVQFPAGKACYKTKKRALEVAKTITKEK